MTHTHNIHTRRNAFTIIELAIVVTIIALVIGGIWVGWSLIRNAELQSVITDAKKYISVTKQFKDKYQYLPGDMANATDYWGLAAGCSVSPSSLPETETCNGDGNGKLNPFGSTTEYFTAWQHLSNAGFIEGSYNGKGGSTMSGNFDYLVPSRNVPAAALQGVVFRFLASITVTSDADPNSLFPGIYRVAVALAPVSKISTASAPVLTPSDALSIDQKMDDGNPGFGTVTVYKSNGVSYPDCTTTTLASTAKYNVAAVGRACSSIFNSQ